ncbi:MAG: hypothetical protein QGI68_03405 [Pseudomonadales bacterium]|jgi:uncharacterized protein YoxC|nr:hypothetical protein [Pseudomonadales bacterium]MDP7145174.1 hypothetical protein [Pseudomonadales bacterium]MDP7358790.1 hypothetical protein [Pseudomonadales bacterium]MDP7594602.1 hypothetical protein [Pseudomonadales bacterium]HJN52486.1 hypothetical protein [Pseudomonadales bacterium]|tara:strand:+ start:3342 stop:3599 length:258 start_codon:yes stop_codon:yes gene_type:complete
MSAIVEMMGAIVILAVIGAGVVNIIKASKMPGGSKIVRSRIEDLEADVVNLETETEELRSRVEVLEKIVTDDKYQLDKDLKDLAG